MNKTDIVVSNHTKESLILAGLLGKIIPPPIDLHKYSSLTIFKLIANTKMI